MRNRSFCTFVVVLVLSVCLQHHCFAGAIPAGDGTLYDALVAIREKCGLKLAFDADLAKTISVESDMSDIECQTALDHVLQDTPLWYVMINDVAVVKPVEEILPEEVIKAGLGKQAESSHVKTFRITGLVRHDATGERLPYSNILIEGSQRGAVANSDGYFTLNVSNKDSVYLIVSHIGYASQRSAVHPPTAGNMLVIDLEAHSISVDAIDVTGLSARDIIRFGHSQGHTTLNVKAMSGMPVLHPFDVILPLQFLPGIDGTTETSSGLRIRKSAPDKNLVLYDGYPVYSIDHFHGILSAFNQKTIKDIQVFKGVSHAKYGGIKGGVVEITGKSGSSIKPGIDAGVDLLSANLLAETPLGRRSSLVVSMRRSYTDLVQSAFYKKQFKGIRYDIENTSQMHPSYLDADPEIPELVFYDLTAKLTVQPTLNDIISLSLFAGNDKVLFDDLKEGTGLFERSEVSNSGLSLRWARQWSPVFYSNLLTGLSSHQSTSLRHNQFMYDRPLVDVRSNILTIEQKLGNEISDYIAELNNSLRLSESCLLDFGFILNHAGTSFDDIYQQSVGMRQITDHSRTFDNQGLIAAAYVQHNFSQGRLRQFDVGLRTSWYGITNELFLEPRVAVSFKIIPRLNIKASYGKHSQFNNRIAVIGGKGYQYLWSLADDNYPVVKSQQFGVGLFSLPWDGFEIDAELYRKRSFNLMAVQNILVRSNVAETAQVRKYFHYDNLTTGFDLFLKQHLGPLQIWLAYTLSKSTDRSGIIADNIEYPALDDQLHELKILAMYLYRGWSLSSSWVYGSGKRWDKPATVADMRNGYRKNDQMLPPYHRLDISLGKTFNVGWMRFEAALKIFNLYDNNNVLSRYYMLNDMPTLSTAAHNIFQINEVNGGRFIYNLVFNMRF